MPVYFKLFVCFTFISLIIICGNSAQTVKQTSLNLQGTWRLVTGITIEKNDSAVTDYTKDRSFIKVINATHFAFMGHDFNKGKDSATAYYVSGGGTYSLKNSAYTEHLEYCSDRQWEKNDFDFTVTVHGDTLVQKGIEKIDSIGINRINIEKYVRLK